MESINISVVLWDFITYLNTQLVNYNWFSWKKASGLDYEEIIWPAALSTSVEARCLFHLLSWSQGVWAGNYNLKFYTPVIIHPYRYSLIKNSRQVSKNQFKMIFCPTLAKQILPINRRKTASKVGDMSSTTAMTAHCFWWTLSGPRDRTWDNLVWPN